MNRKMIALAALAAGFSWAAYAQSGAPARQSPKAEAQCEHHVSGGCSMHKSEAGMRHEGHGMKREGRGKAGGHCVGGMHGKHQS